MVDEPQPQPQPDPQNQAAAGPEEGQPNVWDNLAAFGVTRDVIKAELAPLVGEIMTESHANLLAQITETIRSESVKATDRIQGQLGQVTGPAPTPAPGPATNGAAAAPVVGVPGLDANTVNAALQFFLSKVGGGPPAADGIEPILKMVDTFKRLYDGIAEPFMGVYRTGKEDQLKELSTMHRMGGNLPWDRPEAQPPPGPPVIAQSDVSPGRGDAIRSVAKGIKLGSQA